MRIGQQTETKKVESVELTSDIVKQRVEGHGKALAESNGKINELRNALALEVDRNKQLIGAIKGLQGLLPQGEQIVDPNSEQSEKGVPSDDGKEPCDDSKSAETSEETPTDSK